MELFREIAPMADPAAGRVRVRSVTADSRKVEEDSLFVAVKGLSVDGHEYIDEAVRRGSAAVVVEKGCWRKQKLTVPVLEVEDSREALGLLVAAFWEHPASQMVMIGITGTNGKTTCAYLIEEMIRRAGGTPGVIGTVNYRYGGKVEPASHTTPDPERLQELLRRMADSGVTHVVMEVSSHALAQKRLAGVRFDVAVFTNLSRDHLDFHGDMEEYYLAKEKLFTEHLKKGGTAVVVKDDDPWSARLTRALGSRNVKLITCGVTGDLTPEQARITDQGIQAKVKTAQGAMEIDSNLVGSFNLDNLIAAAGVGLALGKTVKETERLLAGSPGPPGRLERIDSPRGVTVFVDYAHTPDALARVVETLRPLAHRLIVIFGCGGDRDRGKRPLMGKAVASADLVVITSDNPRSEDPFQIMSEIERGLAPLMVRKRLEFLLENSKTIRGYDLVASRRQAIRDVLFYARRGDVVLIAGKGHETEQQVGGARLHFDDREEAKTALAMIRG